MDRNSKKEDALSFLNLNDPKNTIARCICLDEVSEHRSQPAPYFCTFLQNSSHSHFISAKIALPYCIKALDLESCRSRIRKHLIHAFIIWSNHLRNFQFLEFGTRFFR